MRIAVGVRRAVGVAVAGLLAGCGGGEQSEPKPHSDVTADGPTTTASPDRTVEIAMTDHAFVPDVVSLFKGETVRLRFTNEGTSPHEAFIGDQSAQDAHEEFMTHVRAGHAEHAHGEEMIRVEPGKSDDLVVTATKDGELLIGCHEADHWARGMVATIRVA